MSPARMLIGSEQSEPLAAGLLEQGLAQQFPRGE
jgi:hypothetical protein